MQISVNVSESVPSGYQPGTLKRVAQGEKFVLNGVVKTRTSRGISNGYYLTVTPANRPVTGAQIDRDIQVNVRKGGVVSGEWKTRRMVGFQDNGSKVVYRIPGTNKIDTVPVDRARQL